MFITFLLNRNCASRFVVIRSDHPNHCVFFCPKQYHSNLFRLDQADSASVAKKREMDCIYSSFLLKSLDLPNVNEHFTLVKLIVFNTSLFIFN